jgi:hypothetical protein
MIWDPERSRRAAAATSAEILAARDGAAILT